MADMWREGDGECNGKTGYVGDIASEFEGADGSFVRT